MDDNHLPNDVHTLCMDNSSMSLAWSKCSQCGKRISIAEEGLLDGKCLLCGVKTL